MSLGKTICSWKYHGPFLGFFGPVPNNSLYPMAPPTSIDTSCSCSVAPEGKGRNYWIFIESEYLGNVHQPMTILKQKVEYQYSTAINGCNRKSGKRPSLEKTAGPVSTSLTQRPSTSNVKENSLRPLVGATHRSPAIFGSIIFFRPFFVMFSDDEIR